MAGSQYHILLVDDDPDQRRLALEVFKLAGCAGSLTVVAGPKEALTHLHQAQEGGIAERPNLILLDKCLPNEQDGYELLRKIKEMPEFRDIPVIHMSASEDRNGILESYRMGANAFLKKPLTIDESIEQFRSLESFWFSTAKLPI